MAAMSQLRLAIGVLFADQGRHDQAGMFQRMVEVHDLDAVFEVLPA
jgi:hypothetical protein